MFIYHDEAGTITHVVSHADASYDPKSNGETFIKTDLDPSGLYLVKDAGGAFVPAFKKHMAIAGPPPGRVAFGTGVAFADVPEGAAISINGAAHGAMDASGRLDLAPASTGLFTVSFALPGHMDWSQTLEIVASD